jgi:hypothetical protein
MRRIVPATLHRLATVDRERRHTALPRCRRRFTELYETLTRPRVVVRRRAALNERAVPQSCGPPIQQRSSEMNGKKIAIVAVALAGVLGAGLAEARDRSDVQLS